MQKQRNSSFELIRLICILYVVYWHSINPYLDDMASFQLAPVSIINSMCNTTNTLFMLLSGYFGIRFNLEKLIKLDLTIIFYDILHMILVQEIGVKSIVTALLPITFKSHWFLTCYFAIALLSGFLNKIPEKLARKDFRNLLLILLLIFYLFPTIFFTELIEDSGKGIVCMCIVYLVGRYLRLYYSETSFRKAPLLRIFVGCMLVTAALDVVLSLLKGSFMGMYCRDNSIFILIASVAFLLLFKEIKFSSQFINRLTPNIVILYCIEGYVRSFAGRYFSLGDYSYNPFFIGIVLLYALLIIAACILLNELRVLIFDRLDNFITKQIANFFATICRKVMPYITRAHDTLLCAILNH